MSFDPLEIFDFIDDQREEVRRAAMEAIAGLSVDPSFQEALLTRPELMGKLFAHINDVSLPVEHDTWRALVNLAQDIRLAGLLCQGEAVTVAHYICQCAGVSVEESTLKSSFLKEQCIFPDLACMLMANLCKNATCAESVLPFTSAFLKIATTSRDAKFDFIFSALADMTVIAECRRMLTSSTDSIPFLKLMPFMHDVSVVKRGGTAVVVKNCLLEVDCHEALLKDHDDVLLAALLGRLVSPTCNFSPEELDAMLVEVSLEHCTTPAEGDPVVREIIIESLLTLGSTKKGRALMRERQVYPVVREIHAQEAEDDIKDLLVKIVNYMIRDDDEVDELKRIRVD